MKKNLELFKSFFKIGFLTYGGGLAMLPMLKRVIVDENGWASEDELTDVYAISQCTPGVIAVNAATYIGYGQNGVTGGIMATLGVVCPSFIIICLAATVLYEFMGSEILQHALAGVRIVVCALMVRTVFLMGKKTLRTSFSWILFFAALLLSLFSPLPVVLLVILAACAGILYSKIKEAKGFHSSEK